MRTQLVQRLRVIGEMLALPVHGLFPVQAQPGEVLIKCALVFRPAARDIDILDAKKETTAALARQLRVQERGIDVTEVQIAVRRWRETEDGALGHSI